MRLRPKNNEDVTQTHDADIKSPRTTSKNAFASPSSNSSIFNSSDDVKENNTTSNVIKLSLSKKGNGTLDGESAAGYN